MATMTEAVAAALADDAQSTPDVDGGLRLRALSHDLINIVGRYGRSVTNADLDAVRASLAELGYREVNSWVATEGASWLSGGIPSVSFRVRKAAE